MLDRRIVSTSITITSRAIPAADAHRRRASGVTAKRTAGKQPLRASSSSVTVAASAARVSAPVALGRRHGVPLHPSDYGRLNEPVRDAMAMAARLEAMLLDPVYSGKAMAASSPMCVQDALPPEAGCSSSIPEVSRQSSRMQRNSGRGLRTRLGRRGTNGRAAGGKVAIRVGKGAHVRCGAAWLSPSFREWCAECTDAPRAVAEQAPAHVNTNRVEAWHEGNEPERKNRG